MQLVDIIHIKLKFTLNRMSGSGLRQVRDRER